MNEFLQWLAIGFCFLCILELDDKKEKDNRDKNKPLLYEDENTKFDNEHTIEDCKSKFNNVMNFGGAPKYHISEGKNNDINTKHRPDENNITSS